MPGAATRVQGENSEVSNWSRPGGECRHNAGYWNGGEWWGAGGWISIPVNKYLRALARIDYVRDQDRALGLGTRAYEVTVGASIYPFPDNRYTRGLVIRPELRWDLASDKIFIRDLFRSATNGSEFKATQWTAGIDLIYAF